MSAAIAFPALSTHVVNNVKARILRNIFSSPFMKWLLWLSETRRARTVQTVFPGVKAIMTWRRDGVKQPFPRRCIGISEAKKSAALQRIFLISDKDEEKKGTVKAGDYAVIFHLA
ncbi:hypothetical protein [Kluyvera intermedia]|nr:hypothetical protein [Kluyvera intermedia]